MREQLSALYELQGLDITIGRIKARLSALSGARDLKDKLERARPALEAAEKALHVVETELKDNELRLKSIDEKRATFEKRLYSGEVTNPKELSAIEKEIEMLKSQQSQLDGRTLELYDQVEKARSEARVARDNVETLEKQIAEAIEKESAEKVALERQLAETISRREEVAPKITDKALLTRYETVRRKTGNTGIARVIQGKCEGCRISVTPFIARSLQQDKEYVSCESCGRILFLDTE
ncbi:MAG: C4-type zinc ribbon domain-containing protein [Armatimonadetes bacterium]|nr:C4-type zinc ribbon domain-containing protein [Armatimonadota bacterium]